MNVVAADSPSFDVVSHAPTVTILPPDPTAQPWMAGQPNTLAAVADDVEDGWLPESAFQWSSERDGPLGQGSALQIALPAGTHAISVVVTDGDGQPASASTTVVVERAPLGGLMGSVGWLGLAGGGVALLALLGAGATLLFAVARPRERALAALSGQAAAIRQQVQAGTLHPSRVRPLLARDRRGRQWSLDPLRGTWSRWSGGAWRPARRSKRRLPAGLLVLLALAQLALAAAGVFLVLIGLGVVAF